MKPETRTAAAGAAGLRAEDLIWPDWPAPAPVCAVSTTRAGGVSTGRFHALNLGFHVDDSRAAVAENRRRLAALLVLPGEPGWLRQVHGSRVATIEVGAQWTPEADAGVGFGPGPVCAVMTADCLPVLFCDRAGSRVAAAHAGWRGLAGGVLEAVVRALRCDPATLLAWLGPAIGPARFEVGAEVREAFLAADRGAGICFRPSPAGRWLADLYALARRRLTALGIAENAVYGGGWCTYDEPRRFYSYRREGSSGRMASLIWLQNA